MKMDVIPIASETALKIVSILTSVDSHEKEKSLVCKFIHRRSPSLNAGITPTKMQVAEVKINCQPQYKYKSTRSGWVTTLVGNGPKMLDANKNSVMRRIAGVVENILSAADMATIAGLLFSYKRTTR